MDTLRQAESRGLKVRCGIGIDMRDGAALTVRMSDPGRTEVGSQSLPAVGLVANLEAEDLKMLCSYGGFGFFDKGAKLIRQGEPQHSLYLLISGHLHATRNDSGKDILVGEVRQGEWFGEVNIFDPAEASATLTAVEPSQIWKIERGELTAFFEAYPEPAVKIATGVAVALSRRLRAVSAKLTGKVEYESLIAELGGR